MLISLYKQLDQILSLVQTTIETGIRDGRQNPPDEAILM